MGHSAGLRAGTRVCISEQNLALLELNMDRIMLTVLLVCLLTSIQEEGNDQIVHIFETVQVSEYCPKLDFEGTWNIVANPDAE